MGRTQACSLKRKGDCRPQQALSREGFGGRGWWKRRCVSWFLGEGQLESVHPTVEQVI